MEKVSENKLDWALLVLRIFFLGLIFHGVSKLMNIAGTTKFFAGLGIPFAPVFAIVEPLVEVFGSLSLLVGFETTISGILVAISLFVAVLLAVLPRAFSSPMGGPAPTDPVSMIMALITTLLGVEAAYVLIAVSLVLTGPGKFSVKSLMGKKGA